MDEISPFAPTTVAELKEGKINEFKINPKSIGIKFFNPSKLLGKDPEYNANKIIEIFSGKDNEFSEAVCLNAAAALIVAQKFDNFKESYNFSKAHILSGKGLVLSLIHI